MAACVICGNEKSNSSHFVREMMFGFRDKFEYIERGRCGCLQIAGAPVDLSRYYPAGYYSFRDRGRETSGRFRRFINAQKAIYWLCGISPIGFLAACGRKKRPPYFFNWMKRVGARLDHSILDVGSGSGELLLDMHRYGFNDLMGIDPFLSSDVVYDRGPRIFKKDIHDVDGIFDLVILNGSLEHMPDHRRVLKKIFSLLRADRYAIVRIPLAKKLAWRRYGVNWVQIDAPRHAVMHTEETMKAVSESAGFEIADTVFDSYDMQFWGSEQYARDIPLIDSRSYLVDPANSVFTPQQIEEFRAMSVELNRIRDGDQACFYLYKRGS